MFIFLFEPGLQHIISCDDNVICFVYYKDFPSLFYALDNISPLILGTTRPVLVLFDNQSVTQPLTKKACIPLSGFAYAIFCNFTHWAKFPANQTLLLILFHESKQISNPLAHKKVSGHVTISKMEKNHLVYLCQILLT